MQLYHVLKPSLSLSKNERWSYARWLSQCPSLLSGFPVIRIQKTTREQNELVKARACLYESGAVVLGCPLSQIKTKIHLHFLKLSEKRCLDIQTCKIERDIWPDCSRKRTAGLLSRSSVEVLRIVATITAHCPVRKHAYRIGLPYNRICRSCEDPGRKAVRNI